MDFGTFSMGCLLLFIGAVIGFAMAVLIIIGDDFKDGYKFEEYDDE